MGRLFKLFCWVILILVLSAGSAQAQKAVTYDLTIAETVVDFTGKPVKALTVNGSIPAPTIELMEGDAVTIRVHNQMPVETSIHWHGILLPNKEDGVPYLTTPPIQPHTTHTFSFPVIQSGTYWYHSHTGLQEQRGVYGAIVIHPKPGQPEQYPSISGVGSTSQKPEQEMRKQHHAIPSQTDREAVVVLSDWTNENPHQVLKNLKRGLEWYGVKKKTKQSVLGAFKKKGVWAGIKRSFRRMPAMDLSDVAYDAFLINGQQHSVGQAQPGETVRLRVVNASASTYFYINYAGGEMTVIAADGLPVQPIKQDRILVAIAETYDVLVKVPESAQAEFRATSQDGSGSASYWLGTGKKLSAPDIPKPNMYIMGHDPHAMPHGKIIHEGHMNPMGVMGTLGIAGMQHHAGVHAGHQMIPADSSIPQMSHRHHRHPPANDELSLGPVEFEPSAIPSLKERPYAPYHQLAAVKPTTLPDGRPLREYRFHLTGDMTRYIWTLNGKTLKESDYIKIKRGENVRFTMVNDTMMHHPMHLHGHFFRVVNEQGNYSPLKHTVDVPPMGQRVIEFSADEEKDWFFHCHVLYHMKSGMARIVSYEESDMASSIGSIRAKLFQDPWYTWGEVTPMSQMIEGTINASNTRNTLRAVWEYDWTTEFDTELTYERYLNRFVQVLTGTNLYREKGEAFDAVGIAGIRYLLPFMVNSTAWVDSDGDIRVSGEKEISLTRRLSVFGEVEYDTASQFEWVAGARFMLNQTFSIVGQYHSDYGGGAGLTIRF